MKKTSPITLLILIPVGFGIGFLLDLLLVGSGRSMIPVPWTMSLCLALIGIATLLLGLLVRSAIKPGRRIDPITAVQILTVAKASSITGALVTGYTAGLLVFILSRTQVATGMVPQTVVGLVAALILLVCAIVAEWFCRIPPSDPEAEPA